MAKEAEDRTNTRKHIGKKDNSGKLYKFESKKKG